MDQSLFLAHLHVPAIFWCLLIDRFKKITATLSCLNAWKGAYLRFQKEILLIIGWYSYFYLVSLFAGYIRGHSGLFYLTKYHETCKDLVVQSGGTY